jgi:hypothetical protein
LSAEAAVALFDTVQTIIENLETASPPGAGKSPIED